MERFTSVRPDYVCIHAQKNGWSSCPSPSLPAGQLEDFVVEQIKTVGRDPGVLADSLAATQRHLRAEADALVADRKKIEEQVRQHGRSVGELAPRAGFDEEATRQLGRLQDLIRERQEEIAGLNERIAVLEQRMLEPDELAGAIESFDPLWETLPPNQKAKLIHLLIERIEYDGETESISLTFHPTGIRTLTQQHQEAEAWADLRCRQCHHTPDLRRVGAVAGLRIRGATAGRSHLPASSSTRKSGRCRLRKSPPSSASPT